MKSPREIGREVAWHFRTSIRRHSDPFSFRLLFAVLEGRATSMLELDDRPKAYEDVGRLCRWGMVIDELRNFDVFQEHAPSPEYVEERHRARLAEAPQQDLKSPTVQ